VQNSVPIPTFLIMVFKTELAATVEPVTAAMGYLLVAATSPARATRIKRAVGFGQTLSIVRMVAPLLVTLDALLTRIFAISTDAGHSVMCNQSRSVESFVLISPIMVFKAGKAATVEPAMEPMGHLPNATTPARATRMKFAVDVTPTVSTSIMSPAVTPKIELAISSFGEESCLQALDEMKKERERTVQCSRLCHHFAFLS